MTAPALHPDHLMLLSLTVNAMTTRDDRMLWTHNLDSAAAKHGAACEALWDELERQVAVQQGRIPVIDHPSVKYRNMVARWRREIVAVTQDALMGALNDLADGPMLAEED